MYRLKSPFDGKEYAAEFIKDDTVVVFYLNKLGIPNSPIKRIKLRGLEEISSYVNIATNKAYCSDFLQNVRIIVSNNKDFESEMII